MPRASWWCGSLEIDDAVGTPAPGQELGLRRMERAGVIVNTIEWLRTVETINRFHNELPDARELAGMML
jgi:hypothetical protein